MYEGAGCQLGYVSNVSTMQRVDVCCPADHGYKDETTCSTDLGGARDAKRRAQNGDDENPNRSNGSFHCSFESPMILLGNNTNGKGEARLPMGV